MKYNFDEIINRFGTDCEKWESGGHGRVAFSEKSLSFSIADMDFACAPQILDAVRRRLDCRILGYTKVMTPRYARAVCGWFERRFGYYIHSKNIEVGHGVMDGIQNCLRRLMKPGEGLIIQQPVYPPFMHVGRSVRAQLVINKLKNNNGHWEMDFDDLEKLASDPNNKVFLMCSPHNPVGRVWTKEELTKVSDICHKHDVVLISDEIHCDLVRKGVQHTPVAKLFPDRAIITCVSTSKSFNTPGLKIANTIFANDAIQQRAGTPHVGDLANPLSIAGVIAAYEESEEWLDALNAYLDENLQFVKSWLEKNLPKVKYEIPEGTYLAWFDISAYTKEDMTFCQRCGAENHIILEPGEVFGEGGSGFIRFNCATPKSVVEEGLNRFKQALENCK